MKSDKSSVLLKEATKQMNGGKFSRAFTLLKDLLAMDPTHHEARRLLATLLLKFGNLVTAKNAFDSLLQEALQGRDYALAESLLREYLAVGPRCVPFVEMLAFVYEQKGDPIAAAIEYEKAIKVLLEDPESERENHVRELYAKIKQLAPGSFVVERLAPKFEVQSAPPIQPPRPVAEPPVPEPVPAIVSIDTSADTSAEHLSAASPDALEAPVAEPAAAAIVEEPVDVPAFRFAASTKVPEPAACSDTSEDSSPSDEEKDDEDEKVPFPPVNQVPGSPSIEEEVPPAPVPIPEADPEPAPFWDHKEEIPAMAASVTETTDPVPSPLPDPVKPPHQVIVAQDLAPYPPESVVIPDFSTPGELAAEPAPAPPPLSVPEVSWGGASSFEIEAAPPKRVRKSFRVPYTPDRSIATWLQVKLSIFMRRCVMAAGSVTRLITFLIVAAVTLGVLSIAVVAGMWWQLEAKPTETFEELKKVAPPRVLNDPEVNGYFLFLGFSEGGPSNPLHAGYDRWLSAVNDSDSTCLQHQSKDTKQRDEQGISGLFRGADPAAAVASERGRVKEWMTSQAAYLNRYRQWLDMSFDDWGYGYLGSPECGHISSAHRLYVAEGFAQDVTKGVERLETDLAAWRAILARSRTLPMKAMAADAIHDDTAVLSGLLSRPSFDNKMLARVTRLGRPLDPDERSLRWPMQHEFVREVKRMESRLRVGRDDGPAWTLALAKMPLPKQRILNGYAGYYAALIKTPQIPNSKQPKRYDFARTPARTWADYVLNPIDNLLDDQGAPDWEYYAGMMLDTDARLRLVGLQARLRMPAQDTNMSSRLAQAGPSFFDPFTELPMLLNTAQGRLYSIGMDGKDDGGDPTFDISVPIPTKTPP